MSDATSISSLPQTEAAAPALHRFSIAAAALALAGVLTGAMVVSSGGTSYLELHHITAGLSAIAVAILGLWMAAQQPARLGWLLLSLVVVECALGLLPQGAATGIGHSLIAQLLFGAATAAVVCTGSSWSKPPELVADHGWPSLGSLGRITPILVLAQIALGAAYRHKAMGILPHLFGAMVLVLIILCVCIFVMQQFPSHAVLRPAANHLMAIAFTQIFLGIAAFTVRTMTTKSTPAVIGVTAVHACVGAMTLSAAVVLAMQIRRNVFKPPPEE